MRQIEEIYGYASKRWQIRILYIRVEKRLIRQRLTASQGEIKSKRPDPTIEFYASKVGWSRKNALRQSYSLRYPYESTPSNLLIRKTFVIKTQDFKRFGLAMTTKIHPRQIRADLNTHIRREYKQEIIDDFVILLKQGQEPPPLLVFIDFKTDETLLSDGFYRYFSHMKIRPNDMIAVETRLGSPEAARWAALGRTTLRDSGIPINRADKRWFAEQALKHPFGRKLSNRALGNYLAIDHKTVAGVRMELIGTGEIPHVETWTTIDGYRNSPKKPKSSESFSASKKTPLGREVFLPIDNAQLFSNQLLELFSDDYLEECVKAISYRIRERKLLIEKKKPAP